MWCETGEREPGLARLSRPLLVAVLGLLLLLAGSTLLVHAHDEQGLHLHLLRHGDLESPAAAHGRAHAEEHSHENEDSGHVFSTFAEQDQGLLLALPVWEVVRDRDAESWRGPACAPLAAPLHCARAELPAPAAPTRGPPFCCWRVGSGAQRVLRSSHALLI